MAKILIVVQNLSVPKDRRVWLQARALTERGHKVTVICPREPGEAAAEAIEGVEIQRLRIPNQSSGVKAYAFEYLWSFCAFTARIVGAHIRRRFDAIQVCNPPDFFFHLRWLCRLTDTVFIYDQHDLCPELLLSKFPEKKRLLYKPAVWMEKRTCLAANAVICTNLSYAKLMTQRHELPEEKIWIVRNGPVPADFAGGRAEPELKEGHKFLVVYCGAIAEQDGVDLLVRAVGEIVHGLARRDILFTVLGDGPALPAVKRLANRLGVDKWLSFHGWAAREEVVRHLLSADLCVAPEPSNPLNDKSSFIKVVEYMAAGRPIAAFSLPETMASAGGAAVYAEPNDFSELAGKIVDLLGDPKKRTDMQEEAVLRVNGMLSWKHSEKVFLRLYDYLLSHPSPALMTNRREARGWTG